MARTRTLTNLIADVRLRADNQALADAELTEFINQSISDLYDLLMSAFGPDYFEKETTLTASAATTALPTDFLKLTGLWWTEGGVNRCRISKAPNVESEESAIGYGWTSTQPIRYRIQGANLAWTPAPTGSYSVLCKYIPSATRLSSGSDTFDGYNGWEEWVVLDAAMKCLEREGNTEDAALLAPRKQRMEARITSLADRDQAEPARIGDVYATGTTIRRLFP